MKIQIETTRLLLREFESSDAQDLYELNADPLVMRYTGDKPFGNTKDALSFIKDYNAYKKTGMGRWAVIEKESNNFLGWCGLKLHPGDFVDIGFRFKQQHWGKGYATEAATSCLEHGFINLKLSEIIGRAANENLPSIRVLEKLGMSYWKNDACESIIQAKYYKITQTQYFQLKSSY
jgi:RimJ/RimL family protein N-acetyltransferase